MIVRLLLIASVLCMSQTLRTHTALAQTYVPLLDEYEGIAANDGNYMIFPAFENTDPSVRRRAYFIMPKYLVYALDPGDNTLSLGVNHVGFTLLPSGDADYQPRAAIVAAVTSLSTDKTIAAIKDELIKRDKAAGFLEPAFPTPAFEQYEISLIVAANSSADTKWSSTIPGGYPGQVFLVDFKLHSDADRAFVLDTPPSSGRDAKLWGVTVRGKMKGYGNRLNCTIKMNHKQVYDYFAARASGQAYWGLVKADISREVRNLDDKRVVDFGPCRGDQDKIDKLVMPVWTMITQLENDEGERMFYQMVKDVSVSPKHPEASPSGWGFQGSARWATVTNTKEIVFNFNIATPIYWELPMGMLFSSSCPKNKSYFINGSNPAKPCADASEVRKIKTAQIKCVVEYIKLIDAMPFTEDEKRALRIDIRRDGCGWSFALREHVLLSSEREEALRQRFIPVRAALFAEIRTITP